MTIARLWRTSIQPDRASEYEEFACSVSLPMFKIQTGFVGVIMCRDGASCAVISLWADEAAVQALDESPTYRETVERLLASGMLQGEQTLEVAPVHLSFLAQGSLDR